MPKDSKVPKLTVKLKRTPKTKKDDLVRLIECVLINQERIMADLTRLNAATAKLATDVDALIASQGTTQTAIDTAAAAVEAVDAKVVAATPPTA